MAEAELSLSFVKITADTNGETHFSERTLNMSPADYAPPAPPLFVSSHGPASGMITVGFPPGWFGDFHPAPKKQWMIVTQGIVEIGVSDGELRRLPAGTIALLDEAGSKGHSTRVVGDENVCIFVCEVD